MTQAIDRELAAFMARRGEGSGRHPVRVGQRSLVALDRLLRIMPVGTLRPRLPPAPGFGYLIALRDALGRKLLPPPGAGWHGAWPYGFMAVERATNRDLDSANVGVVIAPFPGLRVL
ncbi:hypothetical protein ACFSYD_00540 [Paracoccus aerius]